MTDKPLMTESPTFIAHFSDGEITRMTTWCTPGKLNVARGVKLAQHAYRSRMGEEPPAIRSARFESNGNGKTLKTYNAKELAELAEG
jgi:hypothetical protein